MKKYITGIALLSSALCNSAEGKRPISETPDARVNYPSNFQVDQGCDLFIFGDYLYWIAQEDGLYYAHTGKGGGTAQFPTSTTSNFNGSLKKIDPEWESAFRVGLGLNFPREGYDLLLTWINFSTATSSSVHSSEGTLFSTWAFPDISAASSDTFAKGSWDLDLNVFDLEWGRSSWLGGNFSLRPFFGIRGLIIDQALKNHYRYATEPAILGKVHAESDFWGVGVRAGGDMRFSLPLGFSVYGIASGALLYGKIDNDFYVKENSFKIAKTEDKEWKGASTLQMALGFSWDSHLFKERCHIEFHVGWEHNGFFNVNQMNHYMQQLHKGDYFKEKGNLMLQGAVAGGRFDF